VNKLKDGSKLVVYSIKLYATFKQLQTLLDTTSCDFKKLIRQFAKTTALLLHHSNS